MHRLVIAVAAVAVLLAAVPGAEARIQDSDLQKRVVVTEEAALLSQVDAVSLYLSSERVAFAPRLVEGGVIDVEVTVLDRDLRAKRAKLEDFVTRQTRTFISVLQERLPIYAPSVARTFNPDTDIFFRVNEGPERRPVAICRDGRWSWEPGARGDRSAQASAAPLPPPAKAQKTASPAAPREQTQINEARALEPAKKGCNCPALKK